MTVDFSLCGSIQAHPGKGPRHPLVSACSQWVDGWKDGSGAEVSWHSWKLEQQPHLHGWMQARGGTDRWAVGWWAGASKQSMFARVVPVCACMVCVSAVHPLTGVV